jgi:hypothetical protein
MFHPLPHYSQGGAKRIVIMLKTLIVLLMIALVASLASGLVFLMSDQGNPDKKRLFTSLGVRLGLGACLLLVILYGVMTGQLGQQNPWDLGPSNTGQTQPQE